MIDEIIIGGLALLVLAAFFVKSSWFKVLVMLLLLGALIGREFSIDAYARSHVWQKAHESGWTEQYKEGVEAMAEYCEATRIYVVGISAFITVLFLRGIFDRSQKAKNKA